MTFLQEHPDAIFSVSPFFLKLFFYSKKYKRIFALRSSVEDNDDIFSFLKKNVEQYSFSIKSLAQDLYKTGTDPNHSLMIERFSTETFMLNEGNYVSLWCQNPEIDLYSIAGHYQGDFFWIQYTYLTHARKLYKKVQTIIKRQKKTIKDILKLDECYNFHKEIS